MVEPGKVLDVLGDHILTDGFDLVLDLERSQGSWLVDERDGTRYLDMFTFFASNPVGMNHPGLVEDDAWMERLKRVAVNKPSNSDIYTTHLARFVETFMRVFGDPALPRLFLISGGALAVENALKAAFDWKQQHNAANGRPGDKGTRVLHLTRAFHGRTGYTMSLTNTEPAKTDRYPKFDWPRISTPAVTFPIEVHLADLEAAEQRALDETRRAFEQHPHDIACFIAEPIQGEGGDNHLRAEFLQQIQALCREHDALFVLDEVQTGGGLTGTAWAYQQLGLEPDLVAFGKKLQVCGVMGGRRIEEVPDNVFNVSSRINSTWGGNLVDIFRSTRILEVIESEGLVERAAKLGPVLLERLEGLAERHQVVTNPRGRGLMCALTLPDAGLRTKVLTHLFEDERVMMLGCGPSSLRFRPSLAVQEDEIHAACDALDRAIAAST